MNVPRDENPTDDAPRTDAEDVDVSGEEIVAEGADIPPAEGADITVEQLTEAFAEMMGDDPEEDAAEATSDEAEDSDEVEADGIDEDEACPLSPQSILEALLFVGHPENKPLTVDAACELIRGVDADEITEIVAELNRSYEEEGNPYFIEQNASGMQMRLRGKYQRIRERFYGKQREARLSQAAVETLALVAYNQPMTSAQVHKQRGKPSGAILSQLVRRQLLSVERPKEKPRTPRYATTERFLDLFGLDHLEELPRSDEVARE